MPTSIIIIISLFLLALIILAANIRVVQQSRASVIERLGAFQSVWSVGLHVKIPFIDRVAKTVSLKEQVVDFAPQPVITKDNVTMQIDTVVYYQITDPKLYTYGVENPMSAIENLTATNWISPSPVVTILIPRCVPFWMKPPILGASRSTAWS